MRAAPECGPFMTQLSFLPTFPFPASPLVLFGLLLLAGVIGGELVKRVLGFPRIVGYVLIGLALGGSGLNVVDAGLVREAWIFVDIALGLILFELGRRLDFAWLRSDPWLAATGVLESALAFACVFLAMILYVWVIVDAYRSVAESRRGD